jgi:hypothetical protein
MICVGDNTGDIASASGTSVRVAQPAEAAFGYASNVRIDRANGIVVVSEAENSANAGTRFVCNLFRTRTGITCASTFPSPKGSSGVASPFPAAQVILVRALSGGQSYRTHKSCTRQPDHGRSRRYYLQGGRSPLSAVRANGRHRGSGRNGPSPAMTYTDDLALLASRQAQGVMAVVGSWNRTCWYESNLLLGLSTTQYSTCQG